MQMRSEVRSRGDTRRAMRNASARFGSSWIASALLLGVTGFVACGGSKPSFEPSSFTDGGTTPNTGELDGGTIDNNPPPIDFGDAAPPPPKNGDRDPVTCEEAATARSYVGCDYWPTVVPNLVNELFDYAVVVSNVGTTRANVTVTGPSGTNKTAAVEPGTLATIYLDWVSELKGKGTPLTASTIARGGAYHLVSDVPVIVSQFNALEYKGEGGPPGKDWSSCDVPLGSPGCYSYSNDASLLLPSTAMTGNYRVFGQTGYTRTSPNQMQDATYYAVTATDDDTKVTVVNSAKASVVAGGGITATNPGGSFEFTLNKGDVGLVVSKQSDAHDLSGSLVKATKPVQVISGVPCTDAPKNVQACDHIEETVFPAETIGKHYVVPVSTGPNGKPIGQLVRFYGNQDGTTLTYLPSRPASCPAKLDAGQVADCGRVNVDFEVTGDKEFGVGMVMLGGEILDPGKLLSLPLGDPSLSFGVAVEQFRKSYLFLAPEDYSVSYVDIVGPADAVVTLDGVRLAAPFKAISDGFAVARARLGGGKNGAHTLTSDKPVGIQIVGYGENTSYQYPGGLNLGVIASVPPR